MTPTYENAMPTGRTTTANSSLIGSLFNFDRFITPTIIKFIYIIGLVLIPLATIGSVAAMFLFALVKGAGAAFILPAFIQLIVGIITSLIAILMLRIYCECVAVIFKVKEDLQILKRNEDIA
jgi:hypothetical protein